MAHSFNKLAMSNSGQQYFSCLCALYSLNKPYRAVETVVKVPGKFTSHYTKKTKLLAASKSLFHYFRMMCSPRVIPTHLAFILHTKVIYIAVGFSVSL